MGEMFDLLEQPAEINDMIRRLHDSFAQIRQFSADASHELRTPLTIIVITSYSIHYTKLYDFETRILTRFERHKN